MVAELLRGVRTSFGDKVDVVMVDPRAWILSLFDLIRYNVKATKPVWILDGKKIFEGIPSKEELYSVLS